MEFQLIPLIIAFLLSLSPLLLGMKKKKYVLAIIGCFSTVLVSGAMHILVSVLFAGLFTWLILKEEPAGDQDQNRE